LSKGNPHRIYEHPVIDSYPKGPPITFTLDGKEFEGFDGEPVAMALKAAGVMIHRYTQRLGKPRGIFCAIGRCTDCVMIVDGKTNVRTCITPLRAGMNIQTQDGITPAKGKARE
jgi:predicted molibdopterin-dependent oxidoreductase YjgC